MCLEEGRDPLAKVAETIRNLSIIADVFKMYTADTHMWNYPRQPELFEYSWDIQISGLRGETSPDDLRLVEYSQVIERFSDVAKLPEMT